MKQTTRKLLSLLMALAIVLSLAPTAWAVAPTATITPSTSTTVTAGGSIELTAVISTGYTMQGISWSCNPSTVLSQIGGGAGGSVDPTVTLYASPNVTETTNVTVTVSIVYKDNSTNEVASTPIAEAIVVTVNPASVPSVTAIDLSQHAVDIPVGATQDLTAILTPSTATGAITWSSSNPAVATVTPNAANNKTATVTAVAPGGATITATCGGHSAECYVDVYSVTPTITLNRSSLSLSSATSYGTITASLPTGATGLNNYRVRWTTASSSVAYFYSGGTATNYIDVDVSSTGNSTATVYAGVTGTTTISAQLYHYTSSGWVTSGSPVTCSVTVSGSLPLSLSTASVPYGGASYATVSGLEAWPTAYRVDWSVTSGTGSARIRTTVDSSWSTTAQTMVSGSTSSAIYVYGMTTGSATLTAILKNAGGQELARNSISITIGGSGFSVAAASPTNTSAVYLNQYWSNTVNGYYCTFSADPRLSGVSIRNSSGYSIYYVWTVNGHTAQSTLATSSNGRAGYSYTLYSNNSYLNHYWNNNNAYNTVTCTAYVATNGAASTSNYTYYGSVTWNVYTYYGSEFNVGVTVYDSNPGYDLRDIPDEGSTSIADQIDDWVSKYYGNSSYYNYAVRIYGGTAYESGTSGNRGTLTSSSSSTWLSYSDLDRVVFTPVSAVNNASGNYKITYRFDVNLYYYSNSVADYTVTGTMTFTVKQGYSSGGDISYSAQAGKDVSLAVEDFRKFWTNHYTNGSLTSVVFGSPSGTPSGAVYNSGNKTVGSASYYVSPTGSQSGLDGVYFSPTSSAIGTVRIPFTATGRVNSANSTTNNLYGAVVITYLRSAANAITYTTNVNGTVSLQAQDFIDAYKAAVNTSTTPSNLTIQFQGVPTYGTLTYTGGTTDVRLTGSNIKNYQFAARTSTTGANQIGDVVYSVSGSRTETISYIGYIGATATFSGEVTFNAVTVPEDVRIAYTCYTAAGITLTPASFTGAHTAMSNATYVTLGAPRTGTLSYIGSALPNSILVNSLGSVTYTPSTAVTGTATTDTFTFTAYNSNNVKVASGTVTITVSLPAASGTITSITQFTDIPADSAADWYRTPLSYLISRGVIKGQGDGKFGPESNVQYSDALKFIMNAAGIVETEVSTPGVNWAQNYKERAVREGWISANVDLTKDIPREVMVELAARALGVPASSTASPFTDTTNQWAVALYNTTPQIIQGSNNPQTGKLEFRPNSYLRRNEMVSLVYRMYQYSGK